MPTPKKLKSLGLTFTITEIKDLQKEDRTPINGNINFGSGYLLSYDGSYDIFLARFTPNGVNLWSKRFIGNLDDNGNGVTVDIYGDINMVGDFYQSVNFKDIILTSANTPNAFVAKFAP